MKVYIERSLAERQCEAFTDERARIHNLPAADVAPVVHGEWIPYPSDAYMKCSVCGIEYLKSKMPQVVGYCPNCGAKMDGGKE